MTESDLRHLPVGVEFVRVWAPQYGTYSVVVKPHGSAFIEVRAESGSRGELPAWERVREVR